MTETYHDLGAILENDELKAVTAHSGRACFVTESLLHRVTAAAIVAQTGHTNKGSMRPYARLSAEAEKILQDVIAGKHRHMSPPKQARRTSPSVEVKPGREIAAKATRLPQSPSKLGLREAKKMRSAEVIEISSDKERGGKGKVKVKKGEGSVEGKKKGGGGEEIGEIGEQGIFVFV